FRSLVFTNIIFSNNLVPNIFGICQNCGYKTTHLFFFRGKLSLRNLLYGLTISDLLYYRRQLLSGFATEKLKQQYYYRDYPTTCGELALDAHSTTVVNITALSSALPFHNLLINKG